MWKHLLNGEGVPEPIVNIGQLWVIPRGEIQANRRTITAVDSLLVKIPIDWHNLLTLEEEDVVGFSSIGIWVKTGISR